MIVIRPQKDPSNTLRPISVMESETIAKMELKGWARNAANAMHENGEVHRVTISWNHPRFDKATIVAHLACEGDTRHRTERFVVLITQVRCNRLYYDN